MEFEVYRTYGTVAGNAVGYPGELKVYVEVDSFRLMLIQLFSSVPATEANNLI